MHLIIVHLSVINCIFIAKHANHELRPQQANLLNKSYVIFFKFVCLRKELKAHSKEVPSFGGIFENRCSNT